MGTELSAGVKHKFTEDTATATEVLEMGTEEFIEYLRTCVGGFSDHSLDIIHKEELDPKALLCLGIDPKIYAKMGMTWGMAGKLTHFIKQLPSLDPQKLISTMDGTEKFREHFQLIQNETPDISVLSNPLSLSKLPYPYLGTHTPNDRFQWDQHPEHENGATNGYKEMYITGTLGWGKSHLICALVCYLMQQGKRVLYAPDARWLVGASFEYLRDSFRLAFADDNQTLSELAQCSKMEDLEGLAQKIAGRGITMYVFLDQANALDEVSAGRVTKAEREHLCSSLSHLTYSHFFIQCVSGNFKMPDLALLVQEQVAKIQMNGGLTAKEMQAWWGRIDNKLLPPADVRKNLENLTGRNALLLRGVEEVIHGGSRGSHVPEAHDHGKQSKLR
ncbi:hypothetical protein BDZ91DRAFT_853548 [Kalaharituber pfeilii]|nr:hypothetical protein BDZ91DRAFT_853548 [Kalaharituber pfeilii]